MNRCRTLPAAALAGLATVLLAACSGGPAGPTSTATKAERVDAAQPRIAVNYDGGVVVLDAARLEPVGTAAVDGFTRINPAGDGRHVLVTEAAGFRVLDTGAWTTGGSSYTAAPRLKDALFPAKTGGHVVVHDGRTVLFADGSGEITAFDSADLLDADGLPEVQRSKTAAPHHGVAVQLKDGSMLTTIGTEESRSGALVKDAGGEEVARNEQCPGVHGEGAAKDEALVIGCEDGVLVYDGAFTKIAAPDAFGRTGNVATTDTSPIAFGDYRDDPDAEGSLLQRFALVDTKSKRMRVVDLPEGVEYTFRGLGRGPGDDAVLLGTDGALHLFDETSGRESASIPVVAEWEGPAEWQDPHPALKVQDGVAYVIEPAKRVVHAVDLTTKEVRTSGTLPGVPAELALVTG